ncbi:hypothetical protein KFE25_002035 [Diacronema lutheri]|uniref:Uncharacterized protein n=1 Tax=Diacronema lutheri TaxID=2081491 RepID=A0A8J5XTJ1_DIALT|nr:hypothetical protein KFE25_002035 [Diacronema lutheri]
MSTARIHVLYLERGDDQREEGQRSAGVHLNVAGRGPCLCTGCDGVADVWRGRLDNMQTTLRMCCAEGALFRPFVAQFAFASPRASLLYDVPRLGAWMNAQGAKRPTEALIVGSALRAHAGSLSAAVSGVACDSHATPSEGSVGAGDEAMWAWVDAFISRVRARAHADGGLAVALTLDRKAPILCPSAMSGVLARASGATRRIADVVVAIGGPSGLSGGWTARLNLALADPRLSVSLRGGLQHSYSALLDVLLMHERGELEPALHDRLAVPAELLRRARTAEHELRRAWLAAIGLGSQAQPVGKRALARALDVAHRACVGRLAPGGPEATGALADGPPVAAIALAPAAPPAGARKRRRSAGSRQPKSKQIAARSPRMASVTRTD